MKNNIEVEIAEIQKVKNNPKRMLIQQGYNNNATDFTVNKNKVKGKTF